MDLQNIIVILIVAACIIYAGFHIIKYFQSVKAGKNPCANCTSSCELRRQLDDKKIRNTKNNCKNKKKQCE